MNDYLKDNLLIICPFSYKKAILRYLTENKLMYNIKFMSMEEYIEKKKFQYDAKTINYLVQKGLKVDNALMYLNNLLYLEDKEYNDEKLKYLSDLKKELDELHLLKYDDLFPKMLEKYQIVINGYGMLDSWHKSLFSNAKIINYPIIHDNFTIYHQKKIEDEVEMVMQNICQLLEKGIDINKISIMNIDKEYIPILKRLASIYQIPVDIPNDDSLMGTIIGKEFYQLVMSDKTKEEIVAMLEKYQNNKLYKTIINLLNQYAELDLKQCHEQIKYDLLNQKVSCSQYTNVIKIKNVFDYVDKDEYIFLVGFNNGLIPELKLDIDYIDDNLKKKMGLDLTEEINRLSKVNTLNYLKSINNLVISYKDVSSFNKYYPSILLDEMNYEEKEYIKKYDFSNEANKNSYTYYLDDYLKYGIKNDDMDLLYYNYGENEYLSYHNEFNNLDQNELINYLNNELTLSYSSVDNYYKCGFKYYLSNILKIDMYNETFMSHIGTLFHEVLRHMNDNDFNLDYYYERYLKDKEWTNKEKFFFNKLKSDLEYVIEVIKKHQFITGFNQMLYEEKIDLCLKKSPYVHFKGFVDKIMYKEKNGENLVSIIDYKTGDVDIKINNLIFGLSMQLPIYLYLVKNSDLLKNVKFTGFYLQHILNNDIKKGKKSLEEQKYDNLKLVGYSTNDIERLAVFDSSFQNSEMIKGMKVKQDGTFYSNAKVMSDEEIDQIIMLTENNIINAMNNILEGRFDINPKVIDGELVSCNFCSFKDICYRKEQNKVYLSHEDDE